jgi:RHS repeat-associated protein
VTTYAYDPVGRKTNEIIVNVMTNSFTYNPAGDLRTLADGKYQYTSWGYDAYGRVTSETNETSGETLRYSYHPTGQLSNRWSKAKNNTLYSYDAVGNLTNINYPVSTDIRYKYDALNRLTNMVDAAGTTTYTYDVANRTTVEDGPWANDNVTNLLNTTCPHSSLTIQQPSGTFSTPYSYDSARRLSTVASGAGTYTYYYHPGLNSITASTRLTHRLSLPNTSYITNFYDSRARLSDTYLYNNTGTALNRHSYLYNDGNQRTKQTYQNGDYVDYTYDDAGELLSGWTYNSGGTAITAQKYGFTYDPAWNMTVRTQNVTLTSYTVNTQNQLTAVDSNANGFDNNGNMTSRSPYETFTYDDENQLTKYENSNPFTPSRVDFAYDGKQRLRKATYYTWNGSSWSFSSYTEYVYDGMLLVQERANGSPSVTYTRGTDLGRTGASPVQSGALAGQSFQSAGGIGGLLGRSHGYSSGTWSTHNDYHADGNGNITYLVNSSQTSAAAYRYDPFGRTITSSGTLASANTLRFSSKQLLTAANLYYYGYRFYDPNIQRWLNRDPIGEKGGINLYVYVRNSPVYGIDPDGRNPAAGALCTTGTLAVGVGTVAGAIAALPAEAILGGVLVIGGVVYITYTICTTRTNVCPPPRRKGEYCSNTGVYRS